MYHLLFCIDSTPRESYMKHEGPCFFHFDLNLFVLLRLGIAFLMETLPRKQHQGDYSEISLTKAQIISPIVITVIIERLVLN